MCNQEVNSMQVYKNTNTDFKQLTQPLIQSSGLNFTHRGRCSVCDGVLLHSGVEFQKMIKSVSKTQIFLSDI